MNPTPTLVALVITIILLLVLAGISISAITQTGLFGKAKQATEKYKEAEEKESIQTALYTMQIDMTTKNDSKTKIGKKLYDKNIENGSKIGNVSTDKSWLINNQTQEIIKLEDNSYTELSYASSVGTTKGLIFNLDPSIIENATKDNINEKLGENVELINFDWNENSGLTKNSFNLDGVNDYIKIKYDNEEEKNILAQNGFTFEFYGMINGGTSYNQNNEIINYDYRGIFCYWNGIESKQAGIRFGLFKNGVIWNPQGTGDTTLISDYSKPGDPWNILYPKTEKIQKNKEIHFTISLDCSQEEYTHTLYADGNKLYQGKLNKTFWDTFKTNFLKDLKYFCVGRSSFEYHRILALFKNERIFNKTI